jgi:hypothetical protein
MRLCSPGGAPFRNIIRNGGSSMSRGYRPPERDGKRGLCRPVDGFCEEAVKGGRATWQRDLPAFMWLVVSCIAF